MLLVALAYAQSSPETTRWAQDARRQISGYWGACVDNLGPGVSLPGSLYTTVAEGEVNADGTPASVRIVSPSGSGPLDDCALKAFQKSGRFPVPPAAMFGTGATTAHLSEIVLTLRLADTPPPPPKKGPTIEATRVPDVTVGAYATKIAVAEGGAKNLWCRAPEAPACDIRDARDSMLVFSVTVCRQGADLAFGTAYGPMHVAGGAELLPAAKPCE